MNYSIISVEALPEYTNHRVPVIDLPFETSVKADEFANALVKLCEEYNVKIGVKGRLLTTGQVVDGKVVLSDQPCTIPENMPIPTTYHDYL